MSQIYNGNTKRPKPKESHAGILGISDILLEIQQSASGPRKSAAVVTYLCDPKSCRIFPLKIATTLLSSSRKGTVGA